MRYPKCSSSRSSGFTNKKPPLTEGVLLCLFSFESPGITFSLQNEEDHLAELNGVCFGPFNGSGFVFFIAGYNLAHLLVYIGRPHPITPHRINNHRKNDVIVSRVVYLLYNKIRTNTILIAIISRNSMVRRL